MGVDRNDYIVYGWKLPYEILDNDGKEIDLWSDKYSSMIEGHKGEKYTIISDGMCGDYNVFGLLIASCDGEYEGWGFVNINLDIINQDEVKLKYLEVFDREPDSNPELIIFSHFH